MSEQTAPDEPEIISTPDPQPQPQPEPEPEPDEGEATDGD
jgi:hypothetical protein